MGKASREYSSKNLFLEALYAKESTSISSLLQTYEALLLSSEEEASILHANRLKQYRKEITDKKYLSELRKNFNALYTLIDKTYPDLHFSIDGRIKSILSMDKKIVKNINEHKSLDTLRDTMAFRIMLFGNQNPHELVDLCYDVMNRIIKHTITSYTLCEANSVQDVMDINSEHPEIIIPKKSKIDTKYAYGLKDYILHPKKNGYQSLHATFRANGGQCFEVQVRTFDMHLYAESGYANHDTYKSKKYTAYEFDRTKVHIPGYGVNNDKLFDFVGLEKGLEIMRRQKHF